MGILAFQAIVNERARIDVRSRSIGSETPYSNVTPSPGKLMRPDRVVPAKDRGLAPGLFEQFVAGLAAGWVGFTLCAPFDFLKTLKQMGVVHVIPKHGVEPFSSTLGRSMRGTPILLIASPFSTALNLSAPRALLAKIDPGNPLASQDPWKAMASGAIVGALSSLIEAPSEMIKVHQQNAAESESIFKVVRQVRRHHGLHRLFSGLDVTIARNVAGYGVWHWSFQQGMNAFDPRRNGREDYPYLYRLGMLSALGATAGSLSWLISYPFDLIKTRVEMDIRLNPSETIKFRSWQTARNILAGGPGKLWVGLGWSIWRASVNNAAIFSVEESIMDVLLG